MVELKDNQLTFVNDEGKEILCDIIFTYDSEEFHKSYVFFTEVGAVPGDDGIPVNCAAYVPNETDGTGELVAIETDEEWEMVEKVFNDYLAELDDEECDCDGECDGCPSSCDGCPGCK